VSVKFVAGIVIIIGSIIWLAATGFDGAKAYYKTVDELYAMGTDAYNYRLRVAGEVVAGSIRRTDSRVNFAIAQKGHSLLVSYTGASPLPDTFADRALVVVEGRYRKEGDFLADAVQAKCASKYEAVSRVEAGVSPAGSGVPPAGVGAGVSPATAAAEPGSQQGRTR